jgi:hypothetical protein
MSLISYERRYDIHANFMPALFFLFVLYIVSVGLIWCGINCFFIGWNLFKRLLA